MATDAQMVVSLGKNKVQRVLFGIIALSLVFLWPQMHRWFFC